MATKLERMRIDEVSGVDIPANLTDGWLLTKSVADAIDAPDSDPTVLKRMTAWFRKAEETVSTDSEGEIEMTQEELTAALEAQTEAIGKSVGDAVSAALAASETARVEAEAEAKRIADEAAATAAAEETAAAEAEATVETETETEAPAAEAETTEAPAAITAEQFAELNERVETIAKALESTLDRVGSLVSKTVVRTSLPEADESTEVAKAATEKKPVSTGIFERLAAGETSVHIGRLVS